MKRLAVALALLASGWTGCGGGADSRDDGLTGTGGVATGGSGGSAGKSGPAVTGSGGASTTGGHPGTTIGSGGVTGGSGGSGATAEAGAGGHAQAGGGRGGEGATAGTSGETGAGGAPTTGSGGAEGGGCGVVPVTPNATPQVKNALCYLYQVYGKKILSGQEENNDDNGMNYIFANTGKYPAIRAVDVHNSQAASQCGVSVKNKGLCLVGYHMGINVDGYQGATTKTDINQVLTEGSSLNTTFKARLDNVAAVVQSVQDANGVAIMRLFHEAGGAWFWWSMETGAQYVRLWKYAFNYLTATKGLRAMIWLLPYNGSPSGSFYPGKQWVDLGGADTYAGNGNYSPLTSLYNQCVGIFGATMPIALHECGPIPDPPQLQSANAKWLFFNVWTAPYYQSPSNSVAHLQAVYTSDYVITRDEMPGF